MGFASWSYTVATPSRPDDDALVVCCIATSSLEIDSLVAEVAALCGEQESRRWQQARAEEYGARLLDVLRRHLPTSELIVHLEEHGPDTIRVVVGSQDAADPAQRERELSDRVAAIRRRTWLLWSESLQITMAALRCLTEPSVSIGGAEKAA